MSNLKGRRNRSSSKLETSDQSKKIKELEKALEERDRTIAGLKEKIGVLSSDLEHRKQCVDNLTSERNDLRQKNAALIGKLAELSRKQSVSSFTTLPNPPDLPKR